MSSAEAEWDERFRRGDHASAEIDPLLALSSNYWPLLPAGRSHGPEPRAEPCALDVASGAGRHAVYLAAHGFAVTAVDFSSQALSQVAQRAAAQNTPVETRQADLETAEADLGESLYDLVAVFFFLHRPLFPVLRRAIRPQGLIIYKTYSVDQLRYPGRPRHRIHMLEHNELLREFSDFRVLRYEEEWDGKGTASLIAQKP